VQLLLSEGEMQTKHVSVFLLAAVTALVGGCGGSADSAEPGSTIGAMTLVRGTTSQADLKFFDFCNPIILKAGQYRRSCHMPHVHRMFIGYGNFETSRRSLARDWRQTRWDLWVDGDRVDLPAFGTDDRTLYAFPPAGGKNVTLREWDVILANPTPGKHELHYRSRPGSGATTDATWTFVVGRRVRQSGTPFGPR
jgi:hypothetical protein